MNCLKCNDVIPTFIVIDGKRHSIFYKRSYCFNCSPWGSHNSKQLHTVRVDGKWICNRCGDLYLPHIKRKNGKPRVEGKCKKCLADHAKDRRLSIKKKCVEYLGGSCVRCGYNKCLAALDFHHKNPLEKDFEIGRKKLLSFEKLRIELDKCELLCRNCHAEEHFMGSFLQQWQVGQ